MVVKKKAPEINPIKLFLMGCECTDIMLPVIEKKNKEAKLARFLNNIPLRLPVDAEEQQQIGTVFLSGIDNYFSKKTAKVLKEGIKIEDGYITMPLKVYISTMIRMGLVGKVYVDSDKKYQDFIESNTQNICGYNLSKDANEEVTALDIALFCELVIPKKMYFFIDRNKDIYLMDMKSIKFGLEHQGMEGSIINAFYETDKFIDAFGFKEWKEVILALRKEGRSGDEDEEFSMDLLLKTIERAMSIIPRGNIVIDYKNNSPEYMTHNFKSGDMQKFKELKEYAEIEGSGVGHVGPVAFKGRTVGFEGWKNFKFKKDKKRKK